MSLLIAVIALSVLLALAVVAAVFLWLRNRRATRRMATLNREMLEASRDASVGRRLSIPRDPDSAQFASTVNRLFDALGERDEKIQGRDKLFKDFARTLPEIVIIHARQIIMYQRICVDQFESTSGSDHLDRVLAKRSVCQ